MMKHLTKFFTCLFLGIGFSLFSQTNSSQQSFEVLVNTILTDVAVNSIMQPTIANQPENGSISITNTANGVYNLAYTPNTNYTGTDETSIEYYTFTTTGFTPKYIHFKFDVKSSIIHTVTDYVLTNENTPVSIDVLSNDIASHGPLSILTVSYTNGGSITGANGGVLEFTPDVDFSGKSYFNYVVQDTIGNTKSGAAVIQVQDSINIEASDTIKIATTNKNPATILMPLPGFILDQETPPSYGSISYIGGEVIEYTSNLGNSSMDTFGLQLGEDYYRTVIVETIHIPEPNGFVVDDYIITTKNTSVSFDVHDNDIKKHNISSFSEELIQDENDNSMFSYTPEDDFTGEKIFYYTVFNGVYSETGKITIWVNNFEPQNNATYNLTTPKNTPLVINYDVPISNFNFQEKSQPIHGELDIYSGLDTIEVGCDEISGYNLVVYTPTEDFVGEDAFEIEYCVDNQGCELVKVFVEVRDIGLDSICLCVEDCVWVGDADNDGKVSVTDLLPIAYHQGAVGPLREEAEVSSQWFGQHAENWGSEQMYSKSDVKHVDSNGDGIVLGDDLLEIITFYNNYHTLVGPNNLVIKDFPFTLETNQDTVYAGEHLNLEIHVGSYEYPIVNLNGLAYGINFPPLLIDSSSVEIDFLNDSWFGSNAPTMEIGVQPTAGRIEAAFSRLAGLSTSGHGIVAKLDLIIIQDLEGIKAQDEIIPFDITLESIKVMDGYGNEYLLPTFTKTLYLNLNEQSNTFNKEVDIVMYPNPTRDYIRVHTKRGIDIANVQLFDTKGSLILQKEINYSTARVSLPSGIKTGIYFVRISTEEGNVTRKLIIE